MYCIWIIQQQECNIIISSIPLCVEDLVFFTAKQQLIHINTWEYLAPEDILFSQS